MGSQTARLRAVTPKGAPPRLVLEGPNLNKLLQRALSSPDKSVRVEVSLLE